MRRERPSGYLRFGSSGGSPVLFFYLFIQKNLHQGLVRHILFVRDFFKLIKEAQRQTSGDGLRGWFKMRKLNALGSSPIDIISGVVSGPKARLFIFGLKKRNRFKFLFHARFSPIFYKQ